jgi:hypothetical protein
VAIRTAMAAVIKEPTSVSKPSISGRGWIVLASIEDERIPTGFGPDPRGIRVTKRPARVVAEKGLFWVGFGCGSS